MSRPKFDFSYDWLDGPQKKLRPGDEISKDLTIIDVQEDYYIINDIQSQDLYLYSKSGKCLSDSRINLDLDNKGLIDVYNIAEFNLFLKSVQRYYGSGNPIKMSLTCQEINFSHTLYLCEPELIIEQLPNDKGIKTLIYKVFGEIFEEEFLVNNHGNPIRKVNSAKKRHFGVSERINVSPSHKMIIILENGSL